MATFQQQHNNITWFASWLVIRSNKHCKHSRAHDILSSNLWRLLYGLSQERTLWEVVDEREADDGRGTDD